MVSHSSTLNPQVKPKYDIGFEPINIDEKLNDKKYYSKQGMPNDGYINWSWDVKNIK